MSLRGAPEGDAAIPQFVVQSNGIRNNNHIRVYSCIFVSKIRGSKTNTRTSRLDRNRNVADAGCGLKKPRGPSDLEGIEAPSTLATC